MKTEARSSASAEDRDRKTEDWLVGLRVGLALAECGRGEILRRAARVALLDGEGQILFSTRIDELLGDGEGEEA